MKIRLDSSLSIPSAIYMFGTSPWFQTIDIKTSMLQTLSSVWYWSCGFAYVLGADTSEAIPGGEGDLCRTEGDFGWEICLSFNWADFTLIDMQTWTSISCRWSSLKWKDSILRVTNTPGIRQIQHSHPMWAPIGVRDLARRKDGWDGIVRNVSVS